MTERNFPDALAATARHLRPTEKPFSWSAPGEWSQAPWLAEQFKSAGFGDNVEVKTVEGRMEAGSIDEMVENMLFLRDIFYKGFSEDEIEKAAVILKEEIQKLEAFETTERDVGIKMLAHIAYATK